MPACLDQAVVGDNMAQISNAVRYDLFYDRRIIFIPVDDDLCLPCPDSKGFCQVVFRGLGFIAGFPTKCFYGVLLVLAIGIVDGCHITMPKTQLQRSTLRHRA